MVTTVKEATNPWLAFYRPKPRAKFSLFCFPYAGGAAAMFQSWEKDLPDEVNVCPVQLPGRGNRLSEPRFTHIGPLVEAVAEGLMPHLNRPFGFFGHSMGALIGFELARLLRRKGKRQPSHLFASGCNAPQLPLTARRIFDLPEAEFIEELRRLNGTPAEVLEHAELMQLFVPIIRDDLSVCQTYAYSLESRLDCDITAFGGVGDPGVTQDGVSAWREQTTANFSMNMLPGDHFFVHSARRDVLTDIRHCLRDKL